MIPIDKKIHHINKYGVRAKGRKELLKHLNGQCLTAKQALLAHCYDCMGYYADGKVDCEQKDCGAYQHYPYKDK